MWGASSNDIFVVGGTAEQGEVYHFDGTNWQAMVLPPVPMLTSVYGFGPNLVFAVGLRGTVIAYDGATWTELYAGTGEDLWGIWGETRSDIWIVGGTVGEQFADIIHFDGNTTFTHEVNTGGSSNATALFDVWGIESRVFAVGEGGLILELQGDNWVQVQVNGTADEDFRAIWGISEQAIVAVGGRESGQIAVFDGLQWDSTQPEGVPGLSAVYIVQENIAVIGGDGGFVGSFDLATKSVVTSEAITDMAINGAWADETGRFFLVGGNFENPVQGVALVTAEGDGGVDPPDEVDPECDAENDCPAGQVCDEGICRAVEVIIELGHGNPFQPIPEGGDMPVEIGFQGLGSLYLSYRTTGFTPNGTAVVTLEVTLVDGGTTVVPRQTIPGSSFVEAEPGVNEKLEDFWLVTSNPVIFFGQEAVVTLTITDETNPAIAGTLEQNVVIVNANGP